MSGPHARHVRPLSLIRLSSRVLEMLARKVRPRPGHVQVSDSPTTRFPWGAIKGPPRLSNTVDHLFHCKLLLLEELSVPRPLPWGFELSSMEILAPSGDLVLSFMVRSLPSSIQIPPWITYRWDRTLNCFLFKILLVGLGDSLKVLTWIEIDLSLKILIFPSKSRYSCQIPLRSTF
jgi:hypothetical protein